MDEERCPRRPLARRRRKSAVLCEFITKPIAKIRRSGTATSGARRSIGNGQPTGRLQVAITLARAVLPLCYRNVMALRKKRSISMPPELDAEIAAAAAHAGMTYSAWLADTARKEFTIRAGLAAVSQFEQDHGGFTPKELAEAEEWAAAAAGRARRTGTSSRRRTA